MANTNDVNYGRGNDSVPDYDKDQDLGGRPIVAVGGLSLVAGARIAAPQVPVALARLRRVGGGWQIASSFNVAAIVTNLDIAALLNIAVELATPINTQAANFAAALAAVVVQPQYMRIGGSPADVDAGTTGIANPAAPPDNLLRDFLLSQNFNAVGSQDLDEISFSIYSTLVE